MANKKNIKDPDLQLNAYYVAMKRYKAQNKTYMVVILSLVMILGFVVYLNQMSIWVSVPGQKFKAARAFTDPYLEISAEEHMVAFCQLMFTFGPDTYEANLDMAQHYATNSVYEKWRDFYYVEKQPSGQPAYYSWIENDVIVDLIIDEVNARYEDEYLLVELTGTQVFKKDYDYKNKEEISVGYRAVIEPLAFKNPDNRKGMRIIAFEVFKSEEKL